MKGPDLIPSGYALSRINSAPHLLSPLTCVMSLDGDELEAALVDPGDDGVGGVVGAPAAESAAAGEPGASFRVQRPTARVQLVGAEGDSQPVRPALTP